MDGIPLGAALQLGVGFGLAALGVPFTLERNKAVVLRIVGVAHGGACAESGNLFIAGAFGVAIGVKEEELVMSQFMGQRYAPIGLHGAGGHRAAIQNDFLVGRHAIFIPVGAHVDVTRLVCNGDDG